MWFVKGFMSKAEAVAYQKEKGGEVLWDEWSQKRATHTARGKEYLLAVRAAGLAPEYNRYIVQRRI